MRIYRCARCRRCHTSAQHALCAECDEAATATLATAIRNDPPLGLTALHHATDPQPQPKNPREGA